MASILTWLENHPRRGAWIGAAALVLSNFAVWGRTIRTTWVVQPDDDLVWLSMVRGASVADVPSWFVSQPAFYYRPLTRISFYLDSLIWGDRALGFHLTHLLLYAAAAAALGWLVYEVTRSRLAGFFAASLYDVYPLNREVAGWLSARADVLAALFVFASLALLLRARRRRRFSLWLAAIVCAAAALFSKEAGLALLPIVAVWAVVTSPSLRRSGNHWAWAGITLLALLAIAGGYWWLHSTATQMGGLFVSRLLRLELPLAKVLRWGNSWWYGPVVVQSYQIAHGAVPGAAVLLGSPTEFLRFWGMLGIWAGALAMMLRRAARPALMFLPFYALAVLPAVAVIPHAGTRRLFYLPEAGDQVLTALACWTLLVWCRRRWPRWGWLALSVYAALLSGFLWNTVRGSLA